MSKIKTFRKIISAFAAVSVLTAASALAYAAESAPSKPTIPNDPNHLEVSADSGHDVKVKNENKFDEAHYRVEIKWGSMVYEYTKGTWDPETHTYTRDEVLKPKAASDGIITVSNHSNVPVTVGVSYLHAFYGGEVEGTQAKISCGEKSVICSHYEIGDNPYNVPEENNELRVDLEACKVGATDAPSTEVTVAPVVNDALVAHVEDYGVGTWEIGSFCIRFEPKLSENTPESTEP